MTDHAIEIKMDLLALFELAHQKLTEAGTPLKPNRSSTEQRRAFAAAVLDVAAEQAGGRIIKGIYDNDEPDSCTYFADLSIHQYQSGPRGGLNWELPPRFYYAARSHDAAIPGLANAFFGQWAYELCLAKKPADAFLNRQIHLSSEGKNGMSSRTLIVTAPKLDNPENKARLLQLTRHLLPG